MTTGGDRIASARMRYAQQNRSDERPLRLGARTDSAGSGTAGASRYARNEQVFELSVNLLSLCHCRSGSGMNHVNHKKK